MKEPASTTLVEEGMTAVLLVLIESVVLYVHHQLGFPYFCVSPWPVSRCHVKGVHVPRPFTPAHSTRPVNLNFPPPKASERAA